MLCYYGIQALTYLGTTGDEDWQEAHKPVEEVDQVQGYKCFGWIKIVVRGSKYICGKYNERHLKHIHRLKLPNQGLMDVVVVVRKKKN